MTLTALTRRVGGLFISQKRTLCVCESCTGGMLGSIITRIPGSSDYFTGGIIAYADMIKHRVVGVHHSSLRKHGAVSAEVCMEMARYTRGRLKSDVCIAITGIAGPGGGNNEKRVGLVFICIAAKKQYFLERYQFSGSRDGIRKQACHAALKMVIDMMQCYE